MAAAFAAIKGPSRISGICFSCGKPGTLKKDCFAQKRNKSKAPDVCPWCHKGRHFANQCHSKYDSEGRPIQGNWNPSTERHHAQTQMPQPPQQIPAPQMLPPQTPHRRPQLFA
ncbi:GAK5 protein, partial [Nicator chloris]|nr:GAK5 protein [Nicator chloris]